MCLGLARKREKKRRKRRFLEFNNSSILSEKEIWNVFERVLKVKIKKKEVFYKNSV